MTNKIILTLLAVSLFSCKKDPENDCSKNETSIAGSYKVTAVTYKGSDDAAEVEYFSVWMPEACERDDMLMLNANGTYEYSDVGLVCDPSGNDTGTWSVDGNSMITDGDAATIESYDCKNLILSMPNIWVIGDKVKMTLTRQ